jgi:hypothetical protein
LQPYSFAKLFFTEDICKKSETGISELELYCYVKTSSSLPSDMNAKDAFVQHFNKYTSENLTMSGGLSAPSNPILSSGHDSSNDVFLCLNTTDVNNKDSMMLKQRFTLFNST